MDHRNAKTDRRVLRTKTVLREALLKLMREKPIGKITPTELCRCAGINRNTFYAHYPSPEALLSGIEDQLYGEIHRSLTASPADGDDQTMLAEILQAIQKSGDLCKVLFSERGDKEFLRRIVNIAREKCMTMWRAAGMTDEGGQMEMLYSYTISGIVAVIERWVREDMARSPEEIARFITRATTCGQQAFLP